MKRKPRERLKQGRAVVVSKEYYEAFGLGEGGTITLDTNLGPVKFDVVGVIGSKGLDVGVSFFGLRDKYSQAAVSCLFGTRRDAERYFASTNTRLILLGFADGADEGAIHKQVQELGLRMHTSTKNPHVRPTLDGTADVRREHGRLLEHGHRVHRRGKPDHRGNRLPPA